MLTVGLFKKYYLVDCFNDVPISVSVGLILFFCFGLVLFRVFLGFKRGISWSARLVLLEYLFWIVCYAVIFRDVQAIRAYSFTPFWGYRAIKGWGDLLLTQIILNVIAFIPIGFLLGCSFGKIKWWIVLLFSATFSLLIETP